jgi:serine/threonine-protein kinase
MGLLSELRRRRVFRVAGFYAVAAWVATEVSATVLPLLQVPERFVTGIVIGLIVLFPIVMILSWVYDIGPTGLERTAEVSAGSGPDGRPSMLFHILLLVLAMLVFGYGLFYLGQNRALQAQPRSSIAVLPFENLSNDPAKDYFSDGISEEILHLLAKVDGLSVAARTSSFALRDGKDDIRTIGSKLDVETVLEGSVRWSENSDEVRITAQLIDASSGFHLWSDNFDRDFKDIFDVQTDIANAIVRILRIKLGADQPALAAPTADAEAYDLYLRGRQLLNARRVPQVRESIDFFRRAEVRDPEFAPALAAMAVAYVSLPILSGEPVEQLHTMAEELVVRVLLLSPELAEAHSVRAWLAQYNGDWKRADFGYFAATSMDPNDVTTRVWYAAFLISAGKLAQGQAQAERALELQSDNPLTQAAAATVAMVRNENEACLEHAAAARELGFANAVASLQGICLARLGRMDEAAEMVRVALGPVLEDSAQASLADALRQADSLEQAANLAMADEGAWDNDPWAVWVLAAAGELDAAYERLEQGLTGDGSFLMQLLWTPEAAGVRRDPRFIEFMQTSGVTEVWRNDLPDLCATQDDGRLNCH